MKTPVDVAEGDAHDLDEVMSVMTRAFDPRNGEAWTAAQCAGALSLPGSILLIARRKGRALGFALARSVADEAELLLIAVRPDGQRSGAGRELVRKIVSHYSKNGIKRIHLEVRTDNPAIAFYDCLGFVQCGLRRNYYRRSDGQFTVNIPPISLSAISRALSVSRSSRSSRNATRVARRRDGV